MEANYPKTVEELVEDMMTLYQLKKQGLQANNAGNTISIKLPELVSALNLPGIYAISAGAKNFSEIADAKVSEAIKLFIQKLKTLHPGCVKVSDWTIEVIFK